MQHTCIQLDALSQTDQILMLEIDGHKHAQMISKLQRTTHVYHLQNSDQNIKKWDSVQVLTKLSLLMPIIFLFNACCINHLKRAFYVRLYLLWCVINIPSIIQWGESIIV